MPKLVLFDIDGTLVLTGGAGLRAMNRACEEVVGHRDALAGIPVAGRTDWIILHDTLRKVGRDLDESLFAELRDRYVTHLRSEIEQRGTGVKAAAEGAGRVPRGEHAYVVTTRQELLRKRLNVPVDAPLVGPGVGRYQSDAHSGRVARTTTSAVVSM